MKEIKKDMKDKDNQMEEPKYDKSVYTLKEAIKTEITNILTEAKDKDEAIEIASESFDIDNTPCEWWDIVEPQASEQKG